MTETLKSKIKLWHVGGFLGFIGIGGLLYLAYSWSNNSQLVGIFSPVNGSVWERFKLGFWSVFLYGAIEYLRIGRQAEHYFLGKALGLLAHQFFMVTFFYIYTIFTGGDVFYLNILSYVVGAAVSQVVSYRVISDREAPTWGNRFGMAVLAVHFVLLPVFTFWTPRTAVFVDPTTGVYGRQIPGQAPDRENR